MKPNSQMTLDKYFRQCVGIDISKDKFTACLIAHGACPLVRFFDSFCRNFWCTESHTGPVPLCACHKGVCPSCGKKKARSLRGGLGDGVFSPFESHRVR